jgi:hypothetical protein
MLYDGFDDWEDVLTQFRATAPKNAIPLYAEYNQEAYEGSAFVLFIEEDRLYGVYGSHCSCMGLEDQWEPELIEWSCAVEYLEKTWYLQNKGHVIPYVETLAASSDRGKDIEELRTFVTLKYRL